MPTVDIPAAPLAFPINRYTPFNSLQNMQRMLCWLRLFKKPRVSGVIKNVIIREWGMKNKEKSPLYLAILRQTKKSYRGYLCNYGFI